MPKKISDKRTTHYKFSLTATDWIWVILLSFLTIGWIYPIVGIVAIICMIAPVIYGFIRGGRVWCGSFCPRGNFLGRLVVPLSRKGKIPKILGSSVFRYGLLIFLFLNFGYGISRAWNNPVMIGKVFVQIILVTTLFAVALGIKYQPRTWCTVCPMGTLSVAAIKTRAHLKPLPGRKTTEQNNNHANRTTYRKQPPTKNSD